MVTCARLLTLMLCMLEVTSLIASTDNDDYQSRFGATHFFLVSKCRYIIRLNTCIWFDKRLIAIENIKIHLFIVIVETHCFTMLTVVRAMA